jgi:hypothetical protein
MELNEKIFDLHDQGFKSGKIAQKLRIKKAVVLDVLGEAGKDGLGDIVTNFTEVTGIKSVVEALVDDCGCSARAEKLNDLFPNRKLNDLLTDQFDYLKAFFEPKRPSSVNAPQQKRLIEIYNHVFKSKRKVSNCGPCILGMINELNKIYDRANEQ